MFAHAPRADRGGGRRGGRRRARAPGVRQAVAQRRRPPDDRRRRARRRRHRAHAREHACSGLLDRRRAPTAACSAPAAAGCRVRRSSRSRCGPCTTSRARTRARRSSAPAASRRASTRSRCCWPARARSASAPPRSATRAPCCASPDELAALVRRHGVARVADLVGHAGGRSWLTTHGGCPTRSRATGWSSPSTSATRRGRGAGPAAGAVVRHRQGRHRAVRRGGTRGLRPVARARASGCSPTSSCTTSRPPSSGRPGRSAAAASSS